MQAQLRGSCGPSCRSSVVRFCWGCARQCCFPEHTLRVGPAPARKLYVCVPCLSAGMQLAVSEDLREYLKLLRDRCEGCTKWWACSPAVESYCEGTLAAKDRWSLTEPPMLHSSMLPHVTTLPHVNILSDGGPNAVAGPPPAALQPGPQHAALLAAARQWAASADAAADVGRAGAGLNPRCETVKPMSPSPGSRMGASSTSRTGHAHRLQLLSRQTALACQAICSLPLTGLLSSARAGRRGQCQLDLPHVC